MTMLHSNLDTPYETSLRALLLLAALREPASVYQIAGIDMVAVNAKAYGLDDRNLNGDHRFAKTEFDARWNLTEEAIKQLTLKGLTQLVLRPNGYFYSLTNSGQQVANRLPGSYAADYFASCREILEQAGEKNLEAWLSAMIDDKARRRNV